MVVKLEARMRRLGLYCLCSSLRGACGESEWIDPDTPWESFKKLDSRGERLELVFSDEFQSAGRSFGDGHDPKWTAIAGFPDGNDQVNAYDDSIDFATTADGKLLLKVAHQPSVLEYTNSTFQRAQVTRAYTSSMLQTWNKFCFSHGMVELSAKLPGYGEQPGIWPAFWTFGNLGRAILKQSTDQLWPFSFDECPETEDAAANQAPRAAQKINACLSKARGCTKKRRCCCIRLHKFAIFCWFFDILLYRLWMALVGHPSS